MMDSDLPGVSPQCVTEHGPQSITIPITISSHFTLIVVINISLSPSPVSC